MIQIFAENKDAATTVERAKDVNILQVFDFIVLVRAHADIPQNGHAATKSQLDRVTLSMLSPIAVSAIAVPPAPHSKVLSYQGGFLEGTTRFGIFGFLRLGFGTT